MVRSLSLAIPAAIISSLIGSANGFVLARWRFPGANLVFAFILFGMFIPYQAVMLPLRTDLHRPRTSPRGVPTLIIAHVIYGIPICTLIFRNYYATHRAERDHRVGPGGRRRADPDLRPDHPADLDPRVRGDADLAVHLGLERLPVRAVPHPAANGPVTLGLAALAGGQKVDYAASMAGALITSLPTLIVYILLGRWFIGGLMAGALKG